MLCCVVVWRPVSCGSESRCHVPQTSLWTQRTGGENNEGMRWQDRGTFRGLEGGRGRRKEDNISIGGDPDER